MPTTILRQIIVHILNNHNNHWMSCLELVDYIRNNMGFYVTYAQVYYAINSVIRLCIFERDYIDARHIRYRLYQ